MIADVLKWLSDHRSDLAIGFLPALAVVVLVALFGTPKAWWQGHQERANTRKALATEMASNLTQLGSLWKDVQRPAGPLDFTPMRPDLTAAFRLSEMPPIPWQRTVWETRAVQIAAALDSATFAQVQTFYADLARIDVLKGSLGPPVETLTPNWRLRDGGEHAWAELQDLVPRRLAEGNPLDMATA